LPANTDHQVEWPLFESEDSEDKTVPKESDDVATFTTIELGFGRNYDSTSSSFGKPDYSMLERYASYVNTGFAASLISQDNVVRMNVELLYILMKIKCPSQFVLQSKRVGSQFLYQWN
jgi:hypothetical protein